MPELNAPVPFEEIGFPAQSNDGALDQRVNVDQMLSLVDSILPFEACLFHQIIPLSIEAGHLNLGMVDPTDAIALEYVRRQVSYIKYSVVVCPVDSDWHRQMLSKYLSYAAKIKQQKSPLRSGQTPAWPTSLPPGANSEFATFVVDSPTEITAISAASSPPPATHAPPPAVPAIPSLPKAPQAALSPLQLDLDAVDADGGIGDIASMSPKALMQALVQQVLREGIGRLYFERQAHGGKVLCSQDGVLQSVIDDLSLDLFQSVINELKRLTHLSLLPVTTTKQVEIERLYHQERVLLRLRIIAGSHGEEATLQVLRGAALKFYQQQQIEQLGRDALGIAQTLQQRIHAIRDRSCQSLPKDKPPTATLLAVSNMLRAMEAQINQLIQAQDPPDRS
jgi:type II secretory ATPase GspE/PulE/Tfp pilus assembly ATPase PilB-like protein